MNQHYKSIQNSVFSHLSSVSNHFIVAYSGGRDSHVLLHAVAALRDHQNNLRVRAVHVNHQLSSNADAWESHCRTVCNELGVDLVARKIDVETSSGQSPEAVARELRYGVFTDVLESDECLLTAHHQDDQAETLLLQLLRGAGPKGLAAMPNIVPFSKGHLARPLLEFSREALERYALGHRLKWIDDESNDNTAVNRNFVRHRLLPLIRERWPSVASTLSRSARNCAEASGLLDELATLDYRAVAVDGGDRLSVSSLLTLNDGRQRNVLRYWLCRLNHALPSSKKLRQLQRDALHCSRDATPLIAWCGVEVRRYQDKLYAMKPLTPHDPGLVIPWDLTSPLALPNGLGVLTLESLKTTGASKAELQNVTIRFRQGGERYHPFTGEHSRPLKQCLQEWGVPPWLRPRVPLVYAGDRLVACCR